MTDSEKLEALYRLYEKPLYHIAMAVLHHHEQAEDAVHDAFCKVMRHISKLGEPQAPETRAYMIAAVRSAAFRQYRRNERRNAMTFPFDALIQTIPDTRDTLRLHIEKSELRELLSSLLDSLNDTDRSIVLLHCRDGLTFGEIGRQLGISEAAARKRFERTRKRFRAQKEEMSDEI